jgi:6-phosphogluconolactonase (cycloisomerase 2 family)
MQLSKWAETSVLSATALVVTSLLSGCVRLGPDDYFFVAGNSLSGSGGQIEALAFIGGRTTGSMRTVFPAISSGGSNPVAMAVNGTSKNLYVANASGTIVDFAITQPTHSTVVLTQQESVTPTGTPVALAINPDNAFLYALTSNPATITVYPLTNGTIGAATASLSLNLSGVSATYASDKIIPTGMTLLYTSQNSGAFYISAYDQSAYDPGCQSCVTSSANPGWVFGFSVDTAGNVAAAPHSPYIAGVKPSGVMSTFFIGLTTAYDFVYVADAATNQLISYSVAADNSLTPMAGGLARIGNNSDAVLAVSGDDSYAIVANAADSTISAFTIDNSTGALTSVSTLPTDGPPVAIALDPHDGQFVYTANVQDNTVSGFQLVSQSEGVSATVRAAQGHYGLDIQPTAIIAVSGPGIKPVTIN